MSLAVLYCTLVNPSDHIMWGPILFCTFVDSLGISSVISCAVLRVVGLHHVAGRVISYFRQSNQREWLNPTALL